MPPPPVLALEQVHFSRNQRAILAGVTWRVRPGELAAILGPNGCGKSTLLRLAAGYLWPQSGRIQLLGQTLGQVPLAPLRARIGIVEATAVYPFDDAMTAQDVVASGYFSALTVGYVQVTRRQAAHAGHLLDQVGLGGREAQGYATMSTGERLRCLLARALVRTPELLLLDEPTAGLDLPGREAILATLTRLHRATRIQYSEPITPNSELRTPNLELKTPPAIVTVTHHLEELLPGTANILLLSAAGRMVARGKPRDVLTNAHMTAAYGVPIHVLRRNGRFSAHVDPATWDELL